MDREDIIKLAREAGCIGPDEGGDPNGLWEPHGHENVTELMMKFAALVAEHEREACAKVCRNMIDAEYKTGKVDHNEMAWTQACAAAIRARGEK